MSEMDDLQAEIASIKQKRECNARSAMLFEGWCRELRAQPDDAVKTMIRVLSQQIDELDAEHDRLGNVLAALQRDLDELESARGGLAVARKELPL